MRFFLFGLLALCGCPDNVAPAKPAAADGGEVTDAAVLDASTPIAPNTAVTMPPANVTIDTH